MSETEAPTGYGSTPPQLTYNDYLRVPQLLDLQHEESDPPHHDEMLFIVIHQAYELWFKLILHEMAHALDYMRADKPLRARHFVNRVVEILKLLVRQIHVLETMTPVEFLGFRDRLNPASGFQSIQFRELEYVCGLKDRAYLRFFESRPDQTAALEKRLAEPSVRDVLYPMLRRMGSPIPETIDVQAVKADAGLHKQLMDALLPIYSDPEGQLPLFLLCESLVELDEYLGLWREHHVRVVERVIGYKRGTGGSSGVDYLESTTSKRCFPFLWEVRTYLEKEQ